jgi:hypothetical protein
MVGLPRRSCCGSQLTIMIFDGIFKGASASHFHTTRWRSFEKTRMKVSSVSFGIDETGTNDPKVKTMSPSVAPSANSFNPYKDEIDN